MKTSIERRYRLSKKSVKQYSVQNKRERQEDSLLFFEDDIYAWLCVADGMGGEINGDLASKAAIESVQGSIKNFTDFYVMFRDAQDKVEAIPGYTTLSIARINKTTKECNIAWCGDSPIELVREGRVLHQSTPHATWYGMTRYLGPKERGSYTTHNPECANIQLSEEDLLLVCSDGLDNALEKEYPIDHIPVETYAQRLVERSIELGSTDNCTILVYKT